MLCSCGCKQKTKIITKTERKYNRVRGEYNKYVQGHNLKIKHSYWLNRKVSERTREKMSLSHIGKRLSMETREKLSLARKGKSPYIMTEEIKQKISLTKRNQKVKLSEEEKERLRLININKKLSMETREKLKDILRKRWQDPIFRQKNVQLPQLSKGKKVSERTREKMSISKIGRSSLNKGKNMSAEQKQKLRLSGKKLWQNKEYREKQIKLILKGLMKRPTSYEERIINLCSKYNRPFVYTGDGDFLINYKNPDFVNEKDMVVIEVYYSWFKIRDYGSIENYQEFCREKYESAGWKVIFLDENDLKEDNWE